MKVVTVGTSSIVSSCIKSFKNAGIEVFACVGRDLERVKSFAENNGVQYYSNDYDRVLTSNAYDFVYIATPNNKHYYCVAYCNEHGYMKGKLRIRKAGEEKVYVVKTTKFISEEEMNSIRERKNNASKMKKK